MTLDEYLQNIEPASSLADRMGIKSPSVSRWRAGQRDVPPFRAVQIETLTLGKVTRRELRPKDWHLLWPDYRGLQIIVSQERKKD